MRAVTRAVSATVAPSSSTSTSRAIAPSLASRTWAAMSSNGGSPAIVDTMIASITCPTSGRSAGEVPISSRRSSVWAWIRSMSRRMPGYARRMSASMRWPSTMLKMSRASAGDGNMP